MLMTFLKQTGNPCTVIPLFLLVTNWRLDSGMTEAVTILPILSSKISQSANIFLASSRVNRSSSQTRIQTTVTVHSTSYKTFPAANPTSTTQGTTETTTILPKLSSKISQSANIFLPSSRVNRSRSHATIYSTVTVYSTSNKTFSAANPTPTTQASDNEEDESKKPRIAPQIAIACGACAALVIIVSGVVVVLRTHFQIQDSS